MNGSVMPTVNFTMGSFGVSAERAKEFQMELLMEKLRTKTSQHKSLAETSKAVRMAMLDKRWALDTADRAILQKCLDSLQHSIKVCSLQSLVERLECLSRQLGLKFMVGPSGVDLFISSDMFYLEILLEASGTVKDVKIHHEGKVEQQSCEELVSCISRGDFSDFTAQLEGLTAVYQLNAEKKVKSRAFGALSALEADLAALGQLHATKDPWAAVHKSPIGLVHNRRGGHAMRLTYFVSPYDAARCPNGVLTMEDLTTGAGLSAQVLLESATPHKLQLSPLLSRTQPSSVPMYSALTAANSATLPARFVLKLSQPMAVCGALLTMMAGGGGASAQDGEPPLTQAPQTSREMRPLLALIAKHTAGTDINPNKGLFVTLPDQSQCYFLTESRGLDGCLVTSVPFTHPCQVPALVARLRQQALFNALIASCVRPNSKQDLESSVMVEVSALSWQHISVLLERPGEGGMATLELELPECGSAPRVSLHCGGSCSGSSGSSGGGGSGGVEGGTALEERLSRVLARTLSVPLLVRALQGRWERQGFTSAGAGIEPGGPPPPTAPHPPHNQGNFLNENQQNLFGSQDGNLASMMGNGTGLGMQNIQPSSHATITPVQQMNVEEKKSSKKRKAEGDGDTWTVKKSKPSMMCEVLLESSDSSSESGEESDVEDDNAVQSNNSSNEEEDEQVASPSSQVGFGYDLELSGLDPAELLMGSSNDNKTSGSEFDHSGEGELNDLQDVDEIIRSASTPSKSESKKHRQKNREHRSSSNKLSASSILMELAEGAGLAGSVSITPVSTTPPTTSSPSFSSVLSGMCLDRRPGIEIIPISPSTQAALPSSITITPITSSQAKSMDERHRSERKSASSGKSSRSSSGDRSKDKKKKRRREDAMGPPNKLPLKQDPLTKPVSVSIKPADGSHSPLSIRSSSPNTLIRKFSPSPTHGRSVSITKTSSTGSPGSVKSLGKPTGSSSHHSSPRHSPIPCSPKHTLSGYSSPKNHGTSSPKHSSSSGSSGKPSMSTLKSAASGSPSGKSSSSGYELSKLSKASSGKESSSGSSSSRDKDRKSSGGLTYSSSGSSSPKMKSSSVKLKQLDLSIVTDVQTLNTSGENLISPGLDLSKSATSNQLRNRKGSLSAVIDKLKSAQHCGSEMEMTLAKSSSSTSGSKDRTSSGSSKLPDSKNTSSSGSSKLSDNSKPQEYMIKPSSDGMKITINKTRTKESSSSSSSSKSSSFSGNSGSGSSSLSTSAVKQSSSGTGVQSNTGTGSPKTHTGLKPGVISGPASKKPQVLQSSKTGTVSSSANPSGSGSPGVSGSTKTSSGSSSSTSGSSSKVPFTKSSSNMSSSAPTKSSSKTSTGSPKMSSSATDLSKLGRDRERDKSRSMKSSSGNSSDKSIFSSSKSSERRSSPAPMRDEVDGERAFKMISQHSKEQNFLVEGLIKSLDTSKYQIPKLSARTSSDDTSKSKNTSSVEKSSVQQSVSQPDMGSRSALTDGAPKLLNFMGRQQDMLGSKYSFQHIANAKLPDQIQKSQSSLLSSSKPAMNLSSTSPKLSTPIPVLATPKIDNIDGLQPTNFSLSGLSKSQSDSSKDSKIEGKNSDALIRSNPVVNLKEDSNPKMDFSKTYPAITVCSAETINQSIVKQLESKSFTVPTLKSSEDGRKLSSINVDLGMKPPVSMGKLTPSGSQETEILLDFSSSSKSSAEIKNKLQSVAERAVGSTRRNTPPLVPTQSPSLSVHIVKSPVQSPLIIPSPHSNSPCITDDELMDEAVVGPGK